MVDLYNLSYTYVSTYLNLPITRSTGPPVTRKGDRNPKISI